MEDGGRRKEEPKKKKTCLVLLQHFQVRILRLDESGHNGVQDRGLNPIFEDCSVVMGGGYTSDRSRGRSILHLDFPEFVEDCWVRAGRKKKAGEEGTMRKEG
jgi:hypothetical protein